MKALSLSDTRFFLGPPETIFIVMEIDINLPDNDKRPLNIGIDLDDTLCDFGGEFINYYNNLQKTNFWFYNLKDYSYASFLGISQRYCNELVSQFTTEYIDKLVPFKGSFDSLSSIKTKYNCRLYIVTYRSERFKIQTQEWIDKHYPGIFSGIEFGNYYEYDDDYIVRSKYNMCLSRSIKILIDDNYDILLQCIKQSNDNFMTIVFERPWSKQDIKGIVKFNDWVELQFHFMIRDFILHKLSFSSHPEILIGFSGKIGSGKDTAYNILENSFHFFQQNAFAARLKEVVSVLTKIPVQVIYSENGKNITPPGFNHTIGRLLQLVGESLCNSIDEELWIKCLLDNPKRSKTLIITDVRKKIEAKGIEEKGGIIIRLNGDPALIREKNEAKRDLFHKTETELDDYPNFFCVIENNSTLDVFKERLLYFIVPYLINKLCLL
jgi:hypothetical protein